MAIGCVTVVLLVICYFDFWWFELWVTYVGFGWLVCCALVLVTSSYCLCLRGFTAV